MACPCENNNSAQPINNLYNRLIISDPPPAQGDCPYSIELLTVWKAKLENIKDQQQVDLIGITGYQMNSYLGYVQSALNFPQNPCFFETNLAIIAQIITRIDGL